ncbi:putative receptor-like protein kinase At5g39000 isoform X2 [Andrographis paniculata]|uniref:putative receptor-like protein kinase At5g39000 isoform X2 n=1 Tax=Andrographis paniculata TaxID=175694 RepID=UPI0021E6DBB0|nr:putative receptor-like protein kinase At5g39000 isoform X2 [Andrographis paniculata]
MQFQKMDARRIPFALLFLCFTSIAAGSSSSSPPEGISINCGSAGNTTAGNGKEWLGDARMKSPSLLRIEGSSTTSTVVRKKLISGDDSVPYRTARISRSLFSYAIRVSSGQKTLRLHFNPAPYKGFIGFKDLFTVEVGKFTLLGNYSASLTAQALGVNSVVKEFSLYLHDHQQLNIVFTPARDSELQNSYAFINGIEIFSVLPSLSYLSYEDSGVPVVGQKNKVYVDYNTALELIHRLLVRQISVSVGDFDHMYPRWITEKAREVRNNIWRVPVDVGFQYLIRLHFSQMGYKLIGSDPLMFEVLINEVIAHTNVDTANRGSGHDVRWYVDYAAEMRGHKNEIRRDLVICLRLCDKLIDGNGLLAGFEVFKLSNLHNSLASPNPLPRDLSEPLQTIQTLLLVLGRRYVIVNVLIIILCVVNVVGHKLQEVWGASICEEENNVSSRAQRLCRRFSLSEIQLATRNFSAELLIGRGGFGKVYKGIIDNGETTVAIKRLKSDSSQGAHEFLTEIETLCDLRHYNLVSLIGYCNGHKEMILVYEYMVGGTLADHLFKFPRESDNSSSLTWKQRLNICIGAARGLDYLHTGNGVIHRDVKASNILLDEDFVAKVSDFGLAKREDRSKLGSHVSTRVKGTRGYFDPYYINTCKLTRKSDTYAFGVVLFETLCGRPAVDDSLLEDEQILIRWAREKISKGNIDQIVSSSLREEVSEESLRAFIAVAERCLHDEPKQRLTMNEIVLKLELVLELQDKRKVSGIIESEHVLDDNRGGMPVYTVQPTLGPVGLQSGASSPRDKTNIEVVANSQKSSSKRGKKKASTHKPLWIWPWEGIWSLMKQSKRYELLLEGVQTTKFDWNTIAAATNNFSSSNKLRRDAFGSVYKDKWFWLEGGHVNPNMGWTYLLLRSIRFLLFNIKTLLNYLAIACIKKKGSLYMNSWLMEIWILL